MDRLFTLQMLYTILIGLATGVFSGIFGVGGGIIIIPSLIFLYKYPPATASGTSLVALLLPVGLLGVIEYYRAGKIDGSNIRMGLLVALGVFFGTWFGARIAVALPSAVLQRAFAVFIVVVAIKLWFSASNV